ncbi:MAG: universal stress protein [Deltaproteobacteria bacterium]|nr:MAG: universal stress protein [Deltaproteobacteria bacterium]
MRILLGVDLRIDGHDWLVEQASNFAIRLGGQLDLLYVTGREDAPTVTGRQKALEGLLATVPESVRGEAITRPGAPVEGLLDATANYDALVVGPREPDALTRWFVGPMAARVIHRARCPVLIPRADLPEGDDFRLLVGVDPHRESAKWLVQMGGEWAKALRGRLDIAYVDPVRVPYIADAKVRAQAEREIAEARKPDIQALHALLATLDESVRGEAAVAEGEPGTAIVERSIEYGLVLVGTLERTGVARLVLGSVAEHVVRNADCSVLTLPAILRAETQG